MLSDRLQLQRFELKYVVPEEVALAARNFVQAYLQLDENGAGKEHLSYPVHSIYIDSDDLILYRQTLNGNRNRYKLRIRFYDDTPDTPVFLEIKKRQDNAILKERCPISKAGLREVLLGRRPVTADILSTNPKHICALDNFLRRSAEHSAKPKAHVAYLREAWIDPANNAVRVTMDRNVRFDAEPHMRCSTEMRSPIQVFGDRVVLELKFTGRFPDWFGELVRAFGLTQRSAAKYADGVTLLGKENVQRICSEGPADASELSEVKEVA